MNKERVPQASGNKETGLHKGAENRLATDFLTLEDRRHLKKCLQNFEGILFSTKNKHTNLYPNKISIKWEETIKTF